MAGTRCEQAVSRDRLFTFYDRAAAPSSLLVNRSPSTAETWRRPSWRQS
jgi:hypothetical protein